MGNFPLLWEYSHFYEKLKKACHLVKGNVSKNKLEAALFMEFFPFL
jgi:hypothetical protein